MIKIYEAPPYFLDCVSSTNQRFNQVVINSCRVSLNYLRKSDRFFHTLYKDQPIHYCLFIDLNEPQPDYCFKAYFIFDGVIHRFLSVTFDYAFLFPIFDLANSKEIVRGSTFNEIKIQLSKFSDFITVGGYFLLNSKNHYWTKSVGHSLGFHDDFGLPFVDFGSIDGLSTEKVPDSFLNSEYTLVGMEECARYTFKTAYCVLFAVENIVDGHYIKVLRWQPQKHSELKNHYWGDLFFDLGYVMTDESKELYDYMMNNHSRFLFGKKDGNKITLLGGVNIFYEHQFRFPKCLSNIPIL